MIISEKQIMYLMAIAEDYVDKISQMISQDIAIGKPEDLIRNINKLLVQIRSQQSEELKEIVDKPTTINKEEKLIPVQCYKCKAEFFVHPLQNMNTGYVKDCELHRKKGFVEYEI